MISVRSNWPVLLLVDAEIGRQLHRAAHARRHVDERAVGEHRRIERGEEIVADRHHGAEIFLHQIGMLLHRLRDRHEQHAGLGQLRLERGRDRNRIEHRVDRDAAVAVAALACPHRRRRRSSGCRAAPRARAAECRASRRCAGSPDRSRRATSAVLLLRRGVVIDVLVVDRAVLDLGPFRLAHGEPAPVGVEPPRQHPFGLVLLRRNETDRILGQALRGLLGFDQRLKAILVLVDVDTADLIDGLLYCRHSSLRSRFQGPRVGLSRLWSVSCFGSPLPRLSAA